MDQMIPANGQCVAVTGDHKDRQVLARRRDPSCDRSRSAVDRVHAVGVNVVWETRRTADAGNDHGILALDPQLRHESLERREYRVIATAGAPAHLLITREVLAVQRLKRKWYAGKPSIARAIGAERGRHIGSLSCGQRMIKLRMQLIDGGHGFVPSN